MPPLLQEEAFFAVQKSPPPSSSLTRGLLSVPENPDQLVPLGRITVAHGLRGEVKIQLFNPQSETLLQVPSILLQRPPFPSFYRHMIRRARLASGDVILHLEGIEDREQADELRRCAIFLPREELPPLEDGEFYFFQLEGYRVESTEGKERGTILRVIDAPAQNLLVVAYQGRECLIPLVDALVPKILHETKTVLVTDLPGLFEPDETSPPSRSRPET